MNTKLFFSCLMITLGMLLWMFFQSSSLTFMSLRLAIGFVAFFTMLFSINWNETRKWGKNSLYILITLSLGTVMHIAFNWSSVNYPFITILIFVGLAILIVIYIKYIEPKGFRFSYMKEPLCNSCNDYIECGREQKDRAYFNCPGYHNYKN